MDAQGCRSTHPQLGTSASVSAHTPAARTDLLLPDTEPGSWPTRAGSLLARGVPHAILQCPKARAYRRHRLYSWNLLFQSIPKNLVVAFKK